MSLKNSSDTIGNRTRDLPVCSVVQKVEYRTLCYVTAVGKVLLLVTTEVEFGTCTPNDVIFAAHHAQDNSGRNSEHRMTCFSACFIQSLALGERSVLKYVVAICITSEWNILAF